MDPTYHGYRQGRPSQSSLEHVQQVEVADVRHAPPLAEAEDQPLRPRDVGRVVARELRDGGHLRFK
eukprot:1180802-Prorocentrum_minimum.AAC.3